MTFTRARLATRIAGGDKVITEKALRTLFSLFAVGLIACRPNASPPSPKPAPLIASEVTGVTEIQLPPNPWTLLLTNQPVQPGSQLRTGTNSFLELTSTSNWQRVLLANHSEAAIDRWTQSPSPGMGRDEVQINLRQGLLLIDLPAATLIGASTFEIKGTNFVAGVRSGGTVAAITADGFVLLQTGTIACVLLSPATPGGTLTPTAVVLNPGQMLDPVARIAKPIPASSNQVWNLLF